MLKLNLSTVIIAIFMTAGLLFTYPDENRTIAGTDHVEETFEEICAEDDTCSCIAAGDCSAGGSVCRIEFCSGTIIHYDNHQLGTTVVVEQPCDDD